MPFRCIWFPSCRIDHVGLACGLGIKAPRPR
jgi:hypothetical protein